MYKKKTIIIEKVNQETTHLLNIVMCLFENQSQTNCYYVIILSLMRTIRRRWKPLEKLGRVARHNSIIRSHGNGGMVGLGVTVRTAVTGIDWVSGGRGVQCHWKLPLFKSKITCTRSRLQNPICGSVDKTGGALPKVSSRKEKRYVIL